MNRIYRSVWNEITRTFVAAAETVRACGKRVSSCSDGAVETARPASGRQRAIARRRPLPLALEQRFMFDGAAVDTAAAHAADAAVASVAAPVEVRAADPARDGGKKEVVFVDTAVADYKTLEAGIKDGVAIVEIDGAKDGLAQIAQWAQTHSGYDSISILGHGSQATLNLGTSTVTESSLTNAVVAAELAEVGQALTTDGDLLLYGCDIAKGTDGEKFIADLATATGADVAASDDATGAASRGGDWVLESATGTIDAALLPDGVAGYSGILASGTLAFSTTDTTNVGILVSDGSSSNDITGIQLDIFNTANAADAASGTTAGSLVYFADSTLGLSQGGIVPIDATSGSSMSIGALDTPKVLVIKSHDGSEFSFNSIWVGDYLATESSIKFEGFKDGVSTGSVTLTLDENNNEYEKTFTTSTGLTASIFQNVDEVRITNQNQGDMVWGNWAAFNSISIGAPVVAPTVTSATYDASTNALTVTATGMTTGDTIDTTKLSISGEGGKSYTLSAYIVTASSATSFSVTLNAADQLNVEGLLDNNGSSAATSGTFNLAADASWDSSRTTAADSTNAIIVSSVQTPTLSSASYDAQTGVLTVTGTNLVRQSGSANDIDVTKLSLSGDGGSYTLTSSKVEITSANSFAITLNATDQAALATRIGKNGTVSTGSVTYNIAAADDWNGPVTGGDIADATGNGVTVSGAEPTVASVAVPSNASYKAGQDLDFTVNFSEAVTVSGTPEIAVDVGGSTVQASYVSGSGSTALVFRYAVAAGNNDSDGVSLGALTLDGGSLKDAAGNAATLSLNSVASTASVLVDTSAPAAPLALDLATASDTGSSTTDNITSNTTPTISGTAEAGSTVTLYDGSTALGTTTATGGAWSFTSGTLSAGAHTLTAKATDAAGNVSAASAGLAITIDAVVPVISLTGASLTYTEKDAATAIDPLATVVETGSPGGAILTAGISANAIASDQLSFATGTDSGINVSGTDLRSGTTVIGSVSAASVSGSTTLTITFGSAATASDIQDTVRALRYASSSADPTAASATRTVSFNLTDGAGNIATAASRVIAITAVKDAPTDIALSGSSVSTYDTGANVAVGTLSATDPDSTSFTYTVVSVSLGAADKTANNLFNVAGSTLRASEPGTTPSGTYSIVIEVSDGDKTYQKTLSIVVDNALIVTTANDEAYGGGTYAAELADGGGLSLAEAIAIANASSGGTIKFSDSLAGQAVAGVAAVSHDITLDLGSVSGITLGGAISIDAGKTLTIKSDAGTVTLSGAISGAGGLVKTGAGTQVLSGNNTFTGGVTINAGELRLTGGAALADSTAVSVNSGAILRLISSETIGSLSGAGSLALDAGTLTVGGDNRSTVYAGAISGTGSLTKTGSGTLTLSGSNSYSGATTVSGGTLAVAADANLGGGLVTLAGGTTLAVSGATTIDNTILLNGNAIVNTGANTTLSGAISGSGALSKTGAGTLILSGSNIYTGVTTVDGGTLDVTGGVVSAIEARSGTTVGGTGTICSALTIDAGATLAPGDQGVGTLTVSGLLTFNGTLAVEIAGDASYDKLVLGGGVTYGAASSITVTRVGGYTRTSVAVFTVISGATTESGVFSGVAESATLLSGGDAYTVSYTGGLVLAGVSLPSVSNITSTNSDGAYKAGENVTITVTFDRAVSVSGAPTLTLSDGGTAIYAGGTGSTTLTFTYSVQAGDTAADLDYATTSALSLNGGAIVDASTGLAAALTLATPGAAHSLGANKDIVIDTSAPASPGVPSLAAASDSGASASDAITSDSTPTVSGSAEAGSSVTLYDGAGVLGSVTADGAGAWTFACATLAEGAHSLSAKACDAAGNISAASTALMLTIDTTARTPASLALAASSGSGATTNDSTPTISGTTEANAAVTLYEGTTVLGCATADASGLWSITSTALAEGLHSLTAKACDLAGNTSAVSAGLTVTIDTAAPTVSEAQISIAGATGSGGAYLPGDTVTATWNAAGDGNGDIARVTVDFSAFGGGSAVAATLNAGVWRASYTIAASAADGANRNVSVSATDNAGNVTTRTDSSNATLQTSVTPVAAVVAASPPAVAVEVPPVVNLVVAPVAPTAPSPIAATPVTTAEPMAVPLNFISPTSPLVSPLAAAGTSAALLAPLAIEAARAPLASSDRASDAGAPALTLGGSGFPVVVVSAGRSAGDGLSVNRGLPDQIVAATGEFVIPADAFAHTRGDAVITLQAQQSSGAALPGWVSFDAATGRFVVKAPLGVSGDLTIRVTARDAQGHRAVTTFKIRVGERGGRAQVDRPGRLGFSEQLHLAARPSAALERLARAAPHRHAA